jgi:hypothetical protein
MFERRRHVVRWSIGFVLWACLLAWMAATGYAQQFPRNPLRSVTGIVTDKGREPLRGAVVQLETGGSMAIESYVTDVRGTYRFRNLPPDADYTIWATFRGDHSKKVGMSKFDRKTDRVIRLVVRPGKD